MKILVISPSWVGDMMMSQNLYCTLQARYPQAIVDVMAPVWRRPLLSRIPEVNKTIPMPLDHGALEVGERHKLSHNLREKRYNRAYVLPNSLESTLVPSFTGIPHRTDWRGEMRYGLPDDVRVFDKEAWQLIVERYIVLVYDKDTMRTAQDLSQPLLWSQLQVNEGEKSYTRNQLSFSSERPMIGFCPGAEFGPARRWPRYHCTELAEQLIDEGYQMALFGSTKDHEAGNGILVTLSIERWAWYRDLAGRTQPDQAAILIIAYKAIVANDFDLMYVAAALNHPLVAPYGLSSPDPTPPLSHKTHMIRLITGYHKVRRGGAARGYHQNLTDITPQRILEKLNVLLLREEA